jgi:hypothetical protein
MTKIAIQELKKLFMYDPLTGSLRRNFNRCGEVLSCNLNINGNKYETSHVVWAIHYGEWPNTLIDHIDHDRYNIEISNLRKATYSQNGMNQKHYNPNGAKGITFCADRISKPWRAQIRINGIKINLGRFATKEEAANAYKQAALEHQGEFACLS